jgi:hypothetical protein
MRYQSHLPCDALKPYVRSFVISGVESESTYKNPSRHGTRNWISVQGALTCSKNPWHKIHLFDRPVFAFYYNFKKWI